MRTEKTIRAGNWPGESGFQNHTEFTIPKAVAAIKYFKLVKTTRVAYLRAPLRHISGESSPYGDPSVGNW